MGGYQIRSFMAPIGNINSIIGVFKSKNTGDYHNEMCEKLLRMVF